MKPIASSLAPEPRPRSDAGFTLTEMVAALLVASMLVAGLAELTRRYVFVAGNVKAIQADTRMQGALRAMLTDLDRADPHRLTVTPDALVGEIDGKPLTGRIYLSAGRTILSWSSVRQRRDQEVPGGTHFVLRGGIIMVEAASGEGPPLAVLKPARDAPADCQFDAAAKDCR